MSPRHRTVLVLAVLLALGANACVAVPGPVKDCKCECGDPSGPDC